MYDLDALCPLGGVEGIMRKASQVSYPWPVQDRSSSSSIYCCVRFSPLQVVYLPWLHAPVHPPQGILTTVPNATLQECLPLLNKVRCQAEPLCMESPALAGARHLFALSRHIPSLPILRAGYRPPSA